MDSSRNPLHRFALLLIALLLAVMAGGCASTRITSEWKDESLSRLPLRKVLAVFQIADPGQRRIFEDQMAREFPNTTPSYTVLGDDEVRNTERVKARVRELGFDSVVIMRVVAVERQQSYVPPTPWVVPVHYVDLWGYWTLGWAEVYQPGYIRTDRVVRIATTIYSVPDDKLVFASESETFDPASLPKAVAETAKVISKQIRESRDARS
jgi:hypothetical protein